MQLAVAGTGIRLSDGSTNIIPVGDGRAGGLAAPRPAGPPLAGTRLLPGLGPPPRPAAEPVRRHLRLLPARASRPPPPGSATTWSTPTGGVLDEPATARALAAFVLRGVQCGAVGADEVLALTGVGLPRADRAGPPPAGQPTLPTPSRNKERTHEQLLLPRGRAAAADPAPHRPGRGQGGLHRHPEGRAARHRHEQPARLDQHPLLDPRPAHRRVRHDVLAADRRGRTGRRRGQARAGGRRRRRHLPDQGRADTDARRGDPPAGGGRLRLPRRGRRLVRGERVPGRSPASSGSARPTSRWTASRRNPS